MTIEVTTTDNRDAHLRPARDSTVSWVLLDGEAVLYQNDERRLQRLNPTATEVWLAIDGRREVGDIAASLADSYGQSAEKVDADIRDVLAEYGRLGLLEGVGSEERSAPVAPIAAPRSDSTSQLAAAMGRALDDVGWAVDLGPYQGLGFEFGVRVEDPDLGTYLERVLRPLTKSDEEEPVTASAVYSLRGPHPRSDSYRLYVGPVRVHSSSSPAASADYFLWHVNRMVIDADETHTLLHAAGAVAESGGILIPGRMNAGKSTLVTGLVRSGLGYLTDEAVAIDHESGELLPFQKSIGLDRGSWTVLPEFGPVDGTPEASFQTTRWQVPPDEVRHGAVASRVPLAHIVATRYEADADTTLEELAPADALSILLEQAFGLAPGHDSFESLAELVARTPSHQLVTGNLDEAVAVVRELVGE